MFFETSYGGTTLNVLRGGTMKIHGTHSNSDEGIDCGINDFLESNVSGDAEDGGGALDMTTSCTAVDLSMGASDG